MTNNAFAEVEEFIAQSIFRIEESTERIQKCLVLLNDEETWRKPNVSLNSVGNLILHLCGNITQYIISSLGGKEDKRVRDEEFSTRGGYTAEQLNNKLSATVNEAILVIRNLDRKELLHERTVQGFMLTGMGIIIHVTEHLSYHTGQIALLTKLLKGKDLGFYAGVDLNKKNNQN